MSVRYSSIVVLILIGLPMLAMGQNPPAQNVSDSVNATRAVPAGAISGLVTAGTQSEDQSVANLPPIPAVLGGPASSLAFLSEMERSNYLKGGVNFGVGYTDNALTGSGGQVGNTSYTVFPNVAIEQSTSQMRWLLGYAAGFTVNQDISNQNQGTQDLHFDSEFRLSPHVNLRAAEDFSRTSGMFGASTSSGFQAGANGNLITPLANTMSSQTVVETNYHFVRKDVVGASGSFNAWHYSDVSTGPGTLANTQTISGAAFWLHELFHRDWGGFSYAFQRITFDPSGETRVHSFAAMDTLSLSKTVSVTGFIGPQYSENQGVAATGPNAGQVSTFNNWSLAGGVEGNWQKERTSLAAGYSKRVNSGGGLLGAVGAQNVHAAIRREFFPGWAATFGAMYSSNAALTLISDTSAANIKTTSVGASLERNIGRSLGMQVSYFHDFQNQSGSSASSQNFGTNRNRFSVTLSYQWAKPLGR